jgi:hypothetical protein
MIKRETSVAVSDLHSVSERIKRLAISIDGKPVESTNSAGRSSYTSSNDSHDSNMAAFNESHKMSQFSLNMPQAGNPIVSIMSQANANFDGKYEILNEIGRGGFSVVHRCRDRSSGEMFAVKVLLLCALFVA